MSHRSLCALANALKSVPDPRSKQGVSHPFAGLLTLVLLGLTARQIYLSHIVEWTKHHWEEIKRPLGFKSEKPPSNTTLSRALAKLTLKDFQQAMTDFFRFLLAEQRNLTAAVDGKTSKQFQGADPVSIGSSFSCQDEEQIAEAIQVGNKVRRWSFWSRASSCLQSD